MPLFALRLQTILAVLWYSLSRLLSSISYWESKLNTIFQLKLCQTVIYPNFPGTCSTAVVSAPVFLLFPTNPKDIWTHKFVFFTFVASEILSGYGWGKGDALMLCYWCHLWKWPQDHLCRGTHTPDRHSQKCWYWAEGEVKKHICTPSVRCTFAATPQRSVVTERKINFFNSRLFPNMLLLFVANPREVLGSDPLTCASAPDSQRRSV